MDYLKHRHYAPIALLVMAVTLVIAASMFNGSIFPSIIALLTCVIVVLWRLKLRIHLLTLVPLVMLCFLPAVLLGSLISVVKAHSVTHPQVDTAVLQRLKYCAHTLDLVPPHNNLKWVEGTIPLTIEQNAMLLKEDVPPAATPIRPPEIIQKKAAEPVKPSEPAKAADITEKLIAEAAPILLVPDMDSVRGRTLGKGEYWLAQLKGVYGRVTGSFEVGSWYVDYAQRIGPLGLAGIPKLAAHTHTNPINVPNLIGRIYGPEYYGHDVSTTIHANASFIFNFYLLFGGWGIVLALWAITIMEMFYLFTRWLNPLLLPAFLSIITLACIYWAQSDFGVVLISHGLLASMVILVGLNMMEKLFSRGRACMKWISLVAMVLSLVATGLILTLPKASLNTALVYQGF
jgi:hypothetical protein